MDTEARWFTSALTRQLEMKRDRLDEVDLIAPVGEPFRIGAGAAPDVGGYGRPVEETG